MGAEENKEVSHTPCAPAPRALPGRGRRAKKKGITTYSVMCPALPVDSQKRHPVSFCFCAQNCPHPVFGLQKADDRIEIPGAFNTLNPNVGMALGS